MKKKINIAENCKTIIEKFYNENSNILVEDRNLARKTIDEIHARDILNIPQEKEYNGINILHICQDIIDRYNNQEPIRQKLMILLDDFSIDQDPYKIDQFTEIQNLFDILDTKYRKIHFPSAKGYYHRILATPYRHKQEYIKAGAYLYWKK